MDDFGCQALEWDYTVVPMKEQVNVLGQPDLIKCEIWDIVMQNAEPAYTIEATDIVVNILNITYEKSNLDKVAATEVQLDEYQHKRLWSLLTEFEGFLTKPWENSIILPYT